MEFSTVKLDCACLIWWHEQESDSSKDEVGNNQLTSMNACELCNRSEKGRQDLNAAVVVMFRKKFWQPRIVKLFCKDASKGWGNGVGKTGATLGIVGTDWGADDVVAAGVLDEGDGMAVEKTILEVAASCGWGNACRLWGRQSVNENTQSILGDADRESRTAGCVAYLVIAVIRARARGTTRTAHLMRWDITCFASTETGMKVSWGDISSWQPSAQSWMFVLIGGNGDGGGVSISIAD